MTALFGDVARRDDIAPEQDVLGGFQRLESDVYDFVIEMAYAHQSDSGARAVAFTFVGANGEKLRETMYVTSGTEKGGKNFYVDRDGKQQYLPSFTLANDICIAITGKELAEHSGTEKDVKVTNWIDDKPVEELEKKQVLMDLIGGRVALGVLKQLEDGYPEKTVPRERNAVAKVFTHGDRLTVVEKEAGLKEGVFCEKWLEKNKGVTADRRRDSRNTPVGGAGTAGAPAATTGGATTTTPSLFS